MCTVTFIPQQEGGFILTSNRDESAKRSPEKIDRDYLYGHELLFPRDKGAGGTWIAASSDDRLICLLNGAFDRHDRRPPYRKSRGIMALEFFEFSEAPVFFEKYDFRGIEDFTMITFDNGQLWDFRWDGEQKFIMPLATNEYHIWSSATLYEKPVQEKRKQWLDEWLKDRTDFSRAAILELHKKGGEGNPSIDFMMNRYNYLVQTVSITQVENSGKKMTMTYHDLINDQTKWEALELNTKEEKQKKAAGTTLYQPTS